MSVGAGSIKRAAKAAGAAEERAKAEKPGKSAAEETTEEKSGKGPAVTEKKFERRSAGEPARGGEKGDGNPGEASSVRRKASKKTEKGNVESNKKERLESGFVKKTEIKSKPLKKQSEKGTADTGNGTVGIGAPLPIHLL
nr:hypothetical protein [uncultured Acetatifactor sp.]